jgi:hypothetical protein
LSKADLLTPEERARSIEYIGGQMANRLGVQMRVHPVSVQGAERKLVEQWFTEEIQPLYDRQQELAWQSARRKIGALREAVQAALRVRLQGQAQRAGRGVPSWQEAESNLRKAVGGLEAARKSCERLTDQVRELSELALENASEALVGLWADRPSAPRTDAGPVVAAVAKVVGEGAQSLYQQVQTLAVSLAAALEETAQALGQNNAPSAQDLAGDLREMPQLDLGTLLPLERPALLLAFGRRWARRRILEKLRTFYLGTLDEALSAYGRVLEHWIASALGEIRKRFDAYAEGYRAQLQRLTSETTASPREMDNMKRDLGRLENWPGAEGQPVAAADSGNRSR